MGHPHPLTAHLPMGCYLIGHSLTGHSLIGHSLVGGLSPLIGHLLLLAGQLSPLSGHPLTGHPLLGPRLVG